jgi:hypothetical protein
LSYTNISGPIPEHVCKRCNTSQLDTEVAQETRCNMQVRLIYRGLAALTYPVFARLQT